MTFSPALRKALLATHVTLSVGWIGAVVAYLALDLTVASSADASTVRAAWIAMGLITRWILVPIAVATLATGLLMALGTKWGLFRHYWVVVSLVLTLLAVGVLLSEARVIREAAGVAADESASDAELLALPSTLVHSVGGLLVLIAVQLLNMYKPRGVTPYGWRKARAGPPPTD